MNELNLKIMFIKIIFVQHFIYNSKKCIFKLKFIIMNNYDILLLIFLLKKFIFIKKFNYTTLKFYNFFLKINLE